MYAIFEAKGKQFRAEPDGTIRMPSIDAEPGERLTFDRVLLAERDGGEVLVGRPSVEGASVAAEVVRHGKDDKIVVYKMKRRKGYRRKQGHRQKFTEVRIVEIDLEEATAPAADAEVEAEPPAEAPAAEPEAPAAEVAEEMAPEEAPEAEAEPEAEDEDVEEDEAPEEDEAEAEAQAGEGPEAVAGEQSEAVIPDDVDITNAARKLAEEHGIDVTKIEGTGKEGRVLKGDVQAAVEEQKGE